MIIKLKRVIIKNFEDIYEISDKDNNVINTVCCRYKKGTSEFDINNNGNKVKMVVPKYLKDKTIIYKDNKETGYIEINKTLETGNSWTMEYKNREFKLYEIGLDLKGTYFVIKESEKTISIISKALVVKRFKDSYEIFIEQNEEELIPILCCLYWHLFRGTSHLKNGNTKTVIETLNTISKNIKSKMDFEFIERIATQENYTIDNKSKEAKRSSIMGWILLMIFGIVLVLGLIL